ncbi:5-formyltetrahydrofolate cyclo-ligase [Siphonobacter curvatus]|uniref:5-formyltetrahydrofolate cyclo-ligase n=1 Tax=Siphonobacter curvatus TaxID=2094562 RepID=A0A2S7IF95_9BACT|nr:5-formyltetrahydrofolate cyclo-ligase [Siphonobacter curvatus]PQA53700.1 5-formyltetrahydrofolate cyclo-ligase [Siphonobacter curvatus]
MTKAEIRREFRQRRQKLSEADLLIHTRALSNELIQSDLLRNSKIIHAFLPIRRQKEVDNYVVIHNLRESYPHIHIAVSRSDAQAREMEHYRYTDQTEILENEWGIPEPVPQLGLKIAPEELDAVLVPLLAFDRRGYRVGYGMGFYDRFLAQCRPDVLKIGLSFFEPVESIIDVDNFDIPLTACVTPKGIWRFERSRELL